MPYRDIITIGGSAGSIEPLKRIVKKLPGSLAASVFVVVHRRASDRSRLAKLLNLIGELPAFDADDGESIEPGRVYVAPSDRHLLIAENRVRLACGPEKGLHRHSINTTFRSAAIAYGDRVIGVLLSGVLDDGVSGILDIVHYGGISIVQDPDEARFSSMPLQALESVRIHYRLRSEEIGHHLVDLVNSSKQSPPKQKASANDRCQGSSFTT